MVGPRTSRRISSQPKVGVVEEEEFVSGEQFDFTSSSPQMPLTRARRSSILLTKPPLRTNRRQTLMPTLEEDQPRQRQISGSRMQSAPAAGKQSAKAQHGIKAQNFYKSPVKKTAPQNKAAGSRSKAQPADRALLPPPPPLLVSPTKKIARGSAAFLTDADILRNLDSLLDDTPPHSGAAAAALTPSPAPAKRKSVAAGSSKRKAVGSSRAVRPAVSEKKSKAGKSATVAAFMSPANEDLAADLKLVQVQLQRLKVEVGRAAILSLLESSPSSPARAKQVLTTLIQARSPLKLAKEMPNMASKTPKLPTKTPKRATKTPKNDNKTPKIDSKTPKLDTKTPKLDSKTPKLDKETPRHATKTPKMNNKTPKLATKTPKLAITSPDLDSKKTPKLETKTPLKSSAVKTLKTSVKSSARSTVKKAVVKSEVKAPASRGKSTTDKLAKEVDQQAAAAASSSASPVLKAKKMLKRKTEAGADDSATTPPVVAAKRARIQSPSASSATKANSAMRTSATPVGRRILVAKKTPAAKRLAVIRNLGTPVQVNPSNLLRKNLKRKVETAIDHKISQRPKSSPYILHTKDENSPKFERLGEEAAELKTQVTGTPAQPLRRAGRKFGTALQPSLLTLESPVPQTGRRRVKSSTPCQEEEGEEVQPHPLDLVEATPIRAPRGEREEGDGGSSAPLSPPPQMVTGGLAKMCNIM